MTRQHREPNPLGVAITIAATVFLAAFVLLIRHPELIGWLVAVYAVCALLGALLVAGEARAEASGLRDQLRAEREAAANVVHLPVRSLPMRRDIPRQRTGEHDDLPAADESWLAETPLFRDGDGRWS